MDKATDSKTAEEAPARRVLAVTGTERTAFLQSLVTNDVADLDGRLVYAALLTPQGKYLADFFLTARDDAILIDVDAALADDLSRRLTLYKLRADVAIAPTELHVHRGLGPPPADGIADPRHPDLGWRAYRSEAGAPPSIDWTRLRVGHCIPESGVELIPNETYILEAGFEALSGVDFRKGCYVGQEVTARMKHKTELRKGLRVVEVEGAAPPGTEIVAGTRPAGILYSQAGGQGIAHLRFDRAEGTMQAGPAEVRLPPPS